MMQESVHVLNESRIMVKQCRIHSVPCLIMELALMGVTLGLHLPYAREKWELVYTYQIMLGRIG